MIAVDRDGDGLQGCAVDLNLPIMRPQEWSDLGLYAELSVTDTTGYTKTLAVSLAVARSAAPTLKAGRTMRKVAC